jgi:hypothetical protein
MLIQRFMENYKKAWETSDEHLLASLFAQDGCYHNTPFAVQVGHEQIKQYWQRTKLQADILLSFDILHASALSGIAVVEFEASSLCRDFRIWWHSVIDQ